jgi:hypothetical protein
MTNSPGLVSESCHESTFKLIRHHVHNPFPTGGACVLSVIRFQDGGRRSAGGSVPKLEYDILRRNASTNVRQTLILMIFYFQSGQLGHSTNTIILKSNEHKSYAWVFSVICTFQSSKFFERLSMHSSVVYHIRASALTP